MDAIMVALKLRTVPEEELGRLRAKVEAGLVETGARS